jgi:hypothetical protein
MSFSETGKKSLPAWNAVAVNGLTVLPMIPMMSPIEGVVEFRKCEIGNVAPQ